VRILRLTVFACVVARYRARHLHDVRMDMPLQCTLYGRRSMQPACLSSSLSVIVRGEPL